MATPVGIKVHLVLIVKPVITPPPFPMESLAANTLPLARKAELIMAALLVKPATLLTYLLPHVQPAIKMVLLVKAAAVAEKAAEAAIKAQ